MKLEDQFVSLELSKKLKNLGVKQESLWWWSIDEKIIMPYGSAVKYFDYENHYSAFTVAELGEMLPRYIYFYENIEHEHCLEINKYDDGNWYIGYTNSLGEKVIMRDDKTEADARAKMLIHLLENKLMEL